jgi:hypothetical protein
MLHTNWLSSEPPSPRDQQEALLLLQNKIFKRMHEDENDEGE